MHEGIAAFLTAVGLLTCIGVVAMTAGALCAVIEAEWEIITKHERGTDR